MYKRQRPHRDRDARAHEVDAAARERVALRDELVDHVRREDHDVEAFARANAFRRVDLVRSGVAIAVRSGAPRPDIGSEDAVRNAVRHARSVSYSTGPSGDYLAKLFERWGLADEIASRIVKPAPGIPVGKLVAEGSVELGFQQLSELMFLPGIDVAGPLPPPIQHVTTFSGGVCATSSNLDEARRLLAYLGSPRTAEVKRRNGMEPA